MFLRALDERRSKDDMQFVRFLNKQAEQHRDEHASQVTIN